MKSHNNRSRLICIPILLLLVSAAKSDTKLKIWGVPIEGCRVSLMVDHFGYKFGESVDLHITLQNMTRHEMSFGSGGPLPYDVEIISPDGDPTPLSTWGRQQAHSPKARMDFGNILVKLAAGDTHEDVFFTLNRTYDMSVDGTYKITLHRKLPSESDPLAWIDVVSNTLEIKLDSTN